jgi:hypothetical protein
MLFYCNQARVTVGVWGPESAESGVGVWGQTLRSLGSDLVSSYLPKSRVWGVWGQTWGVWGQT